MTQVTTSKPAQTWQEVVAKKRLQRQEAIAAVVLRALTDVNGSNEAITAIPDAEALVEKISRGEVSSEAVIKAYIKKCVLSLVCCHSQTSFLGHEVLKY